MSLLLGAAKDLASANASNYNDLTRKMEDTLATELQYCGEQGKLVEAEALLNVTLEGSVG